MKKYLLIVILLFVGGNLSAQTTRGTEFWVNFFHNLGGDSMFVIVAAPDGASVTIDMPASTFSSTLNLTTNELRKVYIPSNFEPSNTDTANKYAIHVSSDKQVIVYALSAAPATTDATCVIPESALPGNAEFLISTYVSTGGSNARSNVFSIVPHDSSVLVQITPTSQTSSGRPANVPFTKLLNKGDVFIVRNNASIGLDGSTVKVLTTDKKVSVYQGNDCIAVDCGACDHVYEVVPPTSVYGKQFVITPFFGAGNGYRYNVMGTKNGTVVYKNGFVVDTLDIGEQYAEKMAQDSSLCITTSHPSIVMQMMIGCNSLATGDPAYVYIVPLEQKIKSGIISTSNTNIIQSHFINVLVPKPGIQRFFLDGTKIASTDFNQVYCGDFYFYSNTVQPGSHTIQCDDGFVAYVYGMGGFESYAYFAGAALKNLELSFEPKVIPNCDTGILVKFYPDPDTLTRYKWQFPIGAVADSDTIKNPTVYFKTPGDYVVKLAGYHPDLGWDSTELVNFIEDTTASDFITFRDAIICKDSHVFELPGAEAYDFLWNTGDTGATFSINKSGTYSVIGTNKFTACSVYDTATVVMHDKVEVDFSFHMDKFCPGYPLELYDSSKVSNDTIKIWEWFADFETFSFKQNDTIKSPRANNYDVMLKIVTNKGCVDSLEKRINVDDNPVARFGLQIKDSCVGRGAIVANNASSILLGKFKNFVWEYSDGEKITNGYPFKSFKDTGLHWVRLWAESEGGCVDTSDKQYVRIYPAPASEAALTDSFVCLEKNQFFFTNNTIESEPLFYTWQWGDGSGSALKDPPPKVYADTGNYKIGLVSGYVSTGCTDTFFKTVRVNETPEAKLTLLDASECLGKNFFSFKDNSDAKGGQNKKYKWIWGDGSETLDTATPTKRFAQAGNYRLSYIFSTGKGCEDTTYKNMNVYTSPVAGFDIASASYCQQSNFIIVSNTSVGPGNMRFTWDFDNTVTSTLKNPPTINYLDTGLYTIQLEVLDPLIQCRDTLERQVRILRNPVSKASVDDALICVYGNQFLFNDTAQQSFAGAQYKWLFSDGDSTLSRASIKSFATAGEYTAKSIVYNGTFCSDTSEITVKVGAPTKTEIVTADTVVCVNNNPVQLTHTYIDGPAIIGYNWLNYPEKTAAITKSFLLGNTRIEGYVLNAEECVDTAISLIEMVDKPSNVLSNAKADKQCLFNNEFDFSAITSNGKGPYQYQWLVNSMTWSSNDQFSYTYPLAKQDTVVLITLDENGCRDTVSYPVEIFEQAVVDFETDSICPGESVVLDAKVNPNGIANLSYRWDLGDGVISTQNPVTHKYSGSKIGYPVQVSISTPNGCADTSEIKTVYLYEEPLARFNFTVLEPTSGAIPYEFRDSSLFASSYRWQVDNRAYTSTKFIHNFVNVGPQNVVIWVKNAAGCEDSASQLLLVESPSRIYMANSFSPNNDGRNETFGPEALAPVKAYYFAIYNRWGEKLFETTNPTIQWDGTYKGQQVMQGSYMYMVNLVFQNDTRYVTDGTITVLK